MLAVITLNIASLATLPQDFQHSIQSEAIFELQNPP